MKLFGRDPAWGIEALEHTRNSAAAIPGTVIFTLVFEGIIGLLGVQAAKPYLLPQQFDAWRAIFGKSGVSISSAAWTCALYSTVPLAAGWAIFARRFVAGGWKATTFLSRERWA